MLISLPSCRNSYLEGDFTCAFLEDFDSVTLSFGSHPMAFQCIDAKSYLDKLSFAFEAVPRVMKTCKRAPDRPTPTYVWLTSPAWRYQKAYEQDCRTGQR